MSITSANSVFTLSVATLFSVPQQLQGYAADDAFTTAALKAAETMMGVDGFLSGGFVFVAIEQGITLQADSPSNALFDQWYAAQTQVKDIYNAAATIQLPSLGVKFTMTKGFLTDYTIIPDAKRVLQPRKYGITWQSAIPAPI